MAYHKWDADYWQGEYRKVVEHNKQLMLKVDKLSDELCKTKEKANLLDIAKRPIIFVQENSVKNLPDYVRMLFTVIEYKSGYNKPEMITAFSPFRN